MAKFDTVNLSQNVKYIKNGLTVTSNNVNIHPRDEAGNIILQENSETNPLLIIEPTSTKISTKSMIRVLDTQFKYFKFPVTTPLTNVDTNINIDPDLLDVIYARYKPSSNLTVPIANSGLLFDVVVDGFPQENSNAYTITKDIKAQNVDLRFRAKITHNYELAIPLSNGTIYFYLYRNGPDRQLDRQFNRIVSNVDAYANTLEQSVEGIPQITQDGYGEIAPSTQQSLLLDIRIPFSEFEIGDTFTFGAQAGQLEQHNIIAEQTYWVITNASKNVDVWNQPVE
jgi:hypothetical protein